MNMEELERYTRMAGGFLENAGVQYQARRAVRLTREQAFHAAFYKLHLRTWNCGVGAFGHAQCYVTGWCSLARLYPSYLAWWGK